MEHRWRIARRIVTVPFVAVGLLLTVYVGVAIFGYIKNSSEHYSNFVLAIVAMTGLLGIRNVIDARIRGERVWLFWPRVVFIAAAFAAAVIGASFIRLNAVRLESIAPFFEPGDFVFGMIFTVGVLALTLVHWGWLLTAVIAAAIIYFFYGHLIENVLLIHPEYDPNFVMNYIGLGTTQGFFWWVQIAADSLYFLILYAAILLGVGMLNVILEVGKASGRRVTGGAFFPGFLGSGVVAAVMGQAVSNVVLTGRLTIPMMKKYGYQGSMAGAIEATASSAGQIMPPILGLAAFIIASFLHKPYIEVALSAFIPALLYLCGVGFGVMIYARRLRLPRLQEYADSRMIIRLLPTFLISFAVVIWLLLGYYSPSFAGLMGILAALALCLFQGRYRPSLKNIYEAIDEGFVLVAILSLLLIAIGPLGQAMLTTNLSGRLGAIVVQMMPDNTLILLIGGMVISLILGMGLPTPVAYIIVALAVVPFLQRLGVPPLQAHFFVFYFAVFSTLTPPIAVSVLAAAKLAEASFLKTAINAMKLASTTFIIPFAFVYNPELMSFPQLSWGVVPPVLRVLAIQGAASVAAYGYLFRDLVGWERGLFAVAALVGFGALVDENPLWDWALVGLIVLSSIWLTLTARGRLANAGSE